MEPDILLADKFLFDIFELNRRHVDYFKPGIGLAEVVCHLAGEFSVDAGNLQDPALWFNGQFFEHHFSEPFHIAPQDQIDDPFPLKEIE